MLAVDSLASARAALDQDPAVKAGRFAVELRAWMAGDGIRTVMELPPPAKLEPQLRCRNSERHRQFDFWLGEWEVQLPDGKRAGRNRIEKGQHGCVVRELWTDSTGGVIELRGGLEGKAMVLSGEHREPGKPSRKMRGSWTPLDGGRVRQHIEESADGGATFSTWFDGIYVPVGR